MKTSLYLETSVIGAYLDNGDAFRRDLTIRWWEHEMQDYDAFSSYLVRRELEHFPEPHRTGYLNLAKETNELDIPEEAAILAEGYIERGVIHRRFLSNAVHYAVASVYKLDYFVTWDFGHLANIRKQARLRLFNTAAGFASPTIITPEFLVHSI
ncbi:MAG: hypothetical protein KF756_05880 [Acidobacteria bacterium]|nr:hypothetical protein [Acidobacteriota bacterium]